MDGVRLVADSNYQAVCNGPDEIEEYLCLSWDSEGGKRHRMFRGVVQMANISSFWQVDRSGKQEWLVDYATLVVKIGDWKDGSVLKSKRKVRIKEGSDKGKMSSFPKY